MQILKIIRLWVLLVALASFSYAGQVLAFLPGVSTGKVKSELSKNTGETVVSFKKVNKLQKAMKSDPAAAVVAPGPAIEFAGGYTVVLEGVKKGSTGEKWVIITANDAVNADNISSKKVGIWDLMGRKNLKAFFKKYFKVKIGKTKRVNKFKDLQPLLGLDMVDALALSESDFNKMKKNTSVKLRVIKTSVKPVAYAQVAIPKGGDAASVKSLAKTSKSFLKKLGFDNWRVR